MERAQPPAVRACELKFETANSMQVKIECSSVLGVAYQCNELTAFLITFSYYLSAGCIMVNIKMLQRLLLRITCFSPHYFIFVHAKKQTSSMTCTLNGFGRRKRMCLTI